MVVSGAEAKIPIFPDDLVARIRSFAALRMTALDFAATALIALMHLSHTTYPIRKITTQKYQKFKTLEASFQ